MPVASPPTVFLLVSFIICSSPVFLGPTSQSTLSLVCLPQKVTLSYSPLSIASVKLFSCVTKQPSALGTTNLFVLHVFHLHRIPQNIFSDRGPSSSLRSGRHSARLWGPLSVSPLASIHSPTVEWSGVCYCYVTVYGYVRFPASSVP